MLAFNLSRPVLNPSTITSALVYSCDVTNEQSTPEVGIVYLKVTINPLILFDVLLECISWPLEPWLVHHYLPKSQGESEWSQHPW